MGARVERFDRRFEDGWRLDRGRRSAARVTPRTRLIIVTSPHNPSGVVIDERVARRARATRAGRAARTCSSTRCISTPRTWWPAATGRPRPAATLDGPFRLDQQPDEVLRPGGPAVRLGRRAAGRRASDAAHARRRRQRGAARRRIGSRRSRSARWRRWRTAPAAILGGNLARARAFFAAHPELEIAGAARGVRRLPAPAGSGGRDAVRAAAARRPRRRRRARTLLRIARALPPQPRGPPGAARARPRAAGRGARVADRCRSTSTRSSNLAVAVLGGLGVGIEREWSGHAERSARALRRRAHVHAARPRRRALRGWLWIVGLQGLAIDPARRARRRSSSPRTSRRAVAMSTARPKSRRSSSWPRACWRARAATRVAVGHHRRHVPAARREEAPARARVEARPRRDARGGALRRDGDRDPAAPARRARTGRSAASGRACSGRSCCSSRA